MTMLESQMKSPAGHPQIANRPACSQLVRIENPDGTVGYAVQFEGQPYVLHTFAKGTVQSVEAAPVWLAGNGICVVGGVEVQLYRTGSFVPGMTGLPPVDNVPHTPLPLVPIVLAIAVALIGGAIWMAQSEQQNRWRDF